MKEDLNILNPILTVNIEGISYKLQKSQRAIFVWEQVLDKSIFQLDNSDDIEKQYLFYQMLKCKNEDFKYDFEAFLDVVDEDKVIIDEITEAFTTITQIVQDHQEEDTVKKK